MKTLVIVESPAKAKTIGAFLGHNYTIKSSFGHVRDLPKSKLGVDVEHNFEPQYAVSKDKAKVVKELKAAANKADEILFATDEDREGEAISWHLAHILNIDPAQAKRITFHEITKTALLSAVEHPRHLNQPMVDAQQARRILDRLVGYSLSPFLWRKVAWGLSAGRVQSVAVRLVVEREREIKAFVPQEYWSIAGTFVPKEQGTTRPNDESGGRGNKEQAVTAHLTSLPGKKLDKLDLKNKAEVDTILAALKDTSYTVSSIETKKATRLPLPPFTTSTLQQESNNALGYSAKQTMRLAQQLYEGVELGSEGHVGLITYMRTDAVQLSEVFLAEAQAAIGEEFGAQYQLAEPRLFKNKNKNAQEAHEAVRPTSALRTPDVVKPFLDNSQYRLYSLIWKRAVATQMKEATLNATALDIVSANKYTFHATGQTIIFDGWLKLYPEKVKENSLPVLTEQTPMVVTELKPEQHSTEPPARYSDATLVKVLEEHGIGRPSTYAPTIATIEDRGYVKRDERKKLEPEEIAYLVNDLLVEHFPNIVNYEFTAQMEESLDDIAEGTKEWQPVMAEFYGPFKANLDKKDKELDKKELTETASDQVCEKCGKPMVIKTGRFGRFLACTGYPDCKSTKPIGEEAAALQNVELSAEVCETCGAPLQMKRGRFGSFLGCSKYPDCKYIKKIEKKINVSCPECKQGDMVQKKSKRGKIFFACNRYPECKFAMWDKPNGAKCPKCETLLVFKAKGVIACSNKECGFKKESAE